MTAHAASHVFFRPQSDVGVHLHPRHHLRHHHVGEGQPRDRRAGRRRRDDPGRRARSGRGDPRHRLEHDRPAHRHDDPGVDLAPLRHVPVSRGLVGQGGQGASRRHPVHPADHHRGAVRLPRQRDHRAADRAGDARHLQHAQGAGLSLSVRRDLRLQYRRHRHADRRPAQHPDRLAGRPHLQRLRLPPHAGHHRGDGGAGAHHPLPLGQGPESLRRRRGAGDDDESDRSDRGLAAAQAVARRC